MATESTDHIALEPTKAEALVLHDFLARGGEGTGYEIGNKAEYIVLVTIEAANTDRQRMSHKAFEAR